MIELTADYLTTKAETEARSFHQKGMDKNQLRKFYDEFKIIERKINEKQYSEDNFKKEILPLIKFIKSKIAYNAGRKVNGKILLPRIFKEYLDQQIDNITNIKDFQNFIMHYQAVIGYFTYFDSNSQQHIQQGGARR